MTGYAITQIEVTNPEDYKKYLAKVTDIVTKFGGEYLVRGGEFQCFEGEWKYPRTVVIKFPTELSNRICLTGLYSSELYHSKAFS